MITYQQLREALDYNPETGIFTWKQTRQRPNRIGCEAGSIHPTLGYRMIGLNQRTYYAHRLAWFYVTGEWPPYLIDHKNLDRSDNRFHNLRIANKSENMSNRRAPLNNTSGKKGVSFNKALGMWHAYIGKDGKRVHLGYFASKDAASAAYASAANDLHKDFARSA